MGESLVGFSHLVHVFFLLDGGAGAVEGIEQLVGELVRHGLAASGAAGVDQPAHGEGFAT